LPTAQAAAIPLCTVEPLADCTFRLTCRFIDLSDRAGILNCKIAGAKFTGFGTSIPMVILGHVRAGTICGDICDVPVRLGPGDCYALAPHWSWSLSHRRCEQQLLFVPFSGKFFMEYDRAALKKFKKFFDLLPWDILVNIANTEHGSEFICSSLFERGECKSRFKFKVFLNVFKNAQQGNLLLKHIAFDLGCSLAAVSQVKIGENTSVANWQRAVKASVKTAPSAVRLGGLQASTRAMSSPSARPPSASKARSGA